MDELISRQDAIDAVKELCEHYTPTKSVTHPHMDFVIEELQNLPSAQPKYGRWILCNEQLPDKKGYYLTSDRFGITITQWNGRGWVRTSIVTITEYGRSVNHEPPIIAWMPLPKPYGR